MSLIGQYLDKQSFVPSILYSVPKDLNIVVVIPVYKEPDLEKTIVTLFNGNNPKQSAEIIVVINAPKCSSAEIIAQNNETFVQLKSKYPPTISSKLNLHLILDNQMLVKHAGVGAARKRGLDEAAYRLNCTNNQEGILVSLDADTLCAENYLTEIEKIFDKQKKINACAIRFEHPIDSEYEQINKNICRYELHLRYMVEALRRSHYPLSFHTVGSAFALRASVYAQEGGMNQRKAGEDFYFLQKIIARGFFTELNSTCVFPSARVSDRVPFGTGAAMGKMPANEDELLSYNLQAYKDLALLFCDVDSLFKIVQIELAKYILNLPEALKKYLESIFFEEEIMRINKNCSELKTFRLSFFRLMNSFRVVKFLNYSVSYYQKKSIEMLASELITPAFESNCVELLKNYRAIQEDSYSIGKYY